MINNVVLIGRLTKNPDLRYTASGVAVATFTLAVNRNFKNQEGNTEADFINCVIWRKPAETLVNYAKKGSLIGVTGAIQTRNYENQQGQRVYVTEVVANNFQLLESKNSDFGQKNSRTGLQNNFMDNQSSYQQNASQRNSDGFNNNQSDPFENNSSIDISDDDLPF
ncbi:single-stranded DNA-binding protein [Enterococcus sp. LJL90]